MAGRKSGMIKWGAVLLAIAMAATVVLRLEDVIGSGKLKLPVGNGTPAISLGERHGLILASDGSLWTWGADLLGWPTLGLGSNMLKSTSLRRIGHDTNWVGISAGETHSLAIKSDGTIWTWGENVRSNFGRLVSVYTPVQAAPGNDWKQAAAGGIVSVALKKDGTLWGWGNNWAGSVGITNKNGSAVPVQVGTSTNWVKVWASILETVGLQSDGTLWYWGDNLNPMIGQNIGVREPMKVNADTDWVDVGFGVNTVFAIKSDGSLWVFGRQADRYTGNANPLQNPIPARIGTNTDWKCFARTTGWWCNGLVKKDGSLWFMDASEGKPNGPQKPYKPVEFRRIEFQKPCAAFAAGALHAAAAGYHGPIGVILTPDGEVWTWGLVAGDPLSMKNRMEFFGAKIVGALRHQKGIQAPDADAVFRNEPWQLRNIDP